MAFKLNINWQTKTLIKSVNLGGLMTLPSFTEGDVVPFEIQIIEADPTAVARYITPDISNVSLSLTLEDSTGTPVIVSQPTWMKDVQLGTFTALVDFNTSALGTWIGSAASDTATFKIRRTDADGSVVTIYQATVTVIANLSGATPTAPMVGTTVLTLEAASAMFLKKMGDPGDSVTLVSPDGDHAVSRSMGNDGIEVVRQYNT